VRCRTYGKQRIGALEEARDKTGLTRVRGLRVREALAKNPSVEIISIVSHEITDPSIDSQIATLQASGADVSVDWAGPKTAAQVIRKLHDIGWRPVHLVAIATGDITE
jgi:branched-chain amino acid transport system substrate-binding protein